MFSDWKSLNTWVPRDMPYLNINIYVISMFIGSITYLILTLFVYFKVSQRTLEVKRFLLLCLAWSLYNTALMLQFIMFRAGAPPPRGVLLCLNASNIIGGFGPLIYADFLLTFAKRRSKWYWGTYGIEAIMLIIFIRHDRMYALLEGRDHYYPPPMKLAPLAMLFILIIIVWALVSLRLAYRDADSPIRRKMLRSLFWTSFLIVLAAVSDITFVIQDKGIFPFSILIGLGYAAYFSYAIVKYRFLGIRIAVRKRIIYVVLIVPITTFFLAGTAIAYRSVYGEQSVPFIIFWALLTAIVFYLLRERLEVFIDRVMFKKSYYRQQSLEQLEQDIMHEIDPGTSVKKSVVWLERSLGLKYAEIFLLETNISEDEQYFTTVGSNGKDDAKRISNDSLLVKHLREKPETIFRADLPVLPQFREIYHDLDKEYQALSAEVCVPLVTDRFLFATSLDFQNDLNHKSVSAELRQKFENNSIPLSQNVRALSIEKDSEWLILGKNNKQAYTVRKEEGSLNIYTGNKLSGIIVCGGRRYGKFEEEDRRILGIAAYNIAFAVEKAKLVMELKSANQFKWDLVRWLSHDLNTPLTPIKMIVGALRTKIGNEAADQQAISVVMCEIARLQSLISGLDLIADLDVVSSHTHIKQELIELGSLIEEVAALFEWQAKENGITTIRKYFRLVSNS